MEKEVNQGKVLTTKNTEKTGRKFSMTIKNVKEKMKKTYLKMLKAYSKKKLQKAYKLEQKIILLELELKENK